jgi:cobalt-zinc-cadmium efflux system membrane fusion protein
VLFLLGATAIWGHSTGWTVPKFSELFGNGSKEKDDWCEEHSVPDSICVECDPTLLPRVKSSWCRTHGVHNCPFERPEVAQLHETPTILPQDLERAKRALDLKERPENNFRCKLHERRIQFASEEAITKMGLDIRPVWQGPIEETVVASGEIAFEKPSVTPVSLPVAGRVWHITAKGRIGAQVKRGDVLALVDAIDVGKAKSELLQAFAQVELRGATFDRLNKANSQGAISELKMLEAENAFREAKIRLMGAQQALANLGLPLNLDTEKGMTMEALSGHMRFYGIPADLVRQLDSTTTSANLIPVVAARDGTITAAKVVVGEMADPAKTLFVVADTSRMWLTLNVRNEDVRFLRVRDAKTETPGQKVRFRPDGSDHDVIGELVWRSSEVAERTRTVQFHAVLPNPDGNLLANTYGVGHIILRAEKDALLVPSEAVHWEGDCHIVFVRDKNFLAPSGLKVFHVRTVRVGVKNGSNTEIIAGLLPGEVVATHSSGNLRGELLKNNLGATCGCGH